MNTFKVEGHPDGTLHFYPESQCGSIRDGVAFANGKHGGWVIAYKDLLKMAKLAEQARRPTKRAPDLKRAVRKSKQLSKPAVSSG
jgi:hypothetical protein